MNCCSFCTAITRCRRYSSILKIRVDCEPQFRTGRLEVFLYLWSSFRKMVTIDARHLRFVCVEQMPPPCWANARTNCCSFQSCINTFDCAYGALFPVTLVNKQLLVFLYSYLPTHRPLLTTRGQRGSISMFCYWFAPDRLGVWLVDSHSYRSGLCLIIRWQLVLEVSQIQSTGCLG